MIGFEVWQASNTSLRNHASTWLDHAIHAALAITDREARGGGIGFARLSDGMDHEVPYSPEEWDRKKADYQEGRLAELTMELRGMDWELEVRAQLHDVPSPAPAVTHLAVFLNRPGASTDREPFFERVDLLEAGARLGATGGRMGPSTQAGLTWWERDTGRHDNHYWLVADERLRGPDLAILLGPAHVRILGGLDKIQSECPCERIETVDSTDVVLLQLVETIVINKELERKVLYLGDYLSPLLEW